MPTFSKYLAIMHLLLQFMGLSPIFPIRRLQQIYPSDVALHLSSLALNEGYSQDRRETSSISVVCIFIKLIESKK